MGRKIQVSNYRFFGAVPAKSRHGLISHGPRRRKKNNGAQEEVLRHPIKLQGPINPFSGQRYLVTLSGIQTPTFKEELDRPGITDDGGGITDCGKAYLLNILRDEDQPPIKKEQIARFLAKSEHLKSTEFVQAFVQALVQALHQMGGSLLQGPAAGSDQTVHMPDLYTTQIIISTPTQPTATSPSKSFMVVLAALYHVDKNSALEIIRNADLQEKDVQRSLTKEGK